MEDNLPIDNITQVKRHQKFRKAIFLNHHLSLNYTKSSIFLSKVHNSWVNWNIQNYEYLFISILFLLDKLLANCLNIIEI